MFPKPDFDNKTYEGLRNDKTAIAYIRQHIGGELIGPSVSFQKVSEQTQNFQDPAAPSYKYLTITAKVTAATQDKIYKMRGRGSVFVEPRQGRCPLPMHPMPPRSTLQQALEAAKQAGLHARGIIRIPRGAELGYGVKYLDTTEAAETVRAIIKREACEIHGAKLVGLRPDSPEAKCFLITGLPNTLNYNALGPHLKNCHNWNAIPYGAPIKNKTQKGTYDRYVIATTAPDKGRRIDIIIQGVEAEILINEVDKAHNNAFKKLKDAHQARVERMQELDDQYEADSHLGDEENTTGEQTDSYDEPGVTEDDMRAWTAKAAGQREGDKTAWADYDAQPVALRAPPIKARHPNETNRVKLIADTDHDGAEPTSPYHDLQETGANLMRTIQRQHTEKAAKITGIILTQQRAQAQELAIVAAEAVKEFEEGHGIEDATKQVHELADDALESILRESKEVKHIAEFHESNKLQQQGKKCARPAEPNIYFPPGTVQEGRFQWSKLAKEATEDAAMEVQSLDAEETQEQGSTASDLTRASTATDSDKYSYEALMRRMDQAEKKRVDFQKNFEQQQKKQSQETRALAARAVEISSSTHESLQGMTNNIAALTQKVDALLSANPNIPKHQNATAIHIDTLPLPRTRSSPESPEGSDEGDEGETPPSKLPKMEPKHKSMYNAANIHYRKWCRSQAGEGPSPGESLWDIMARYNNLVVENAPIIAEDEEMPKIENIFEIDDDLFQAHLLFAQTYHGDNQNEINKHLTRVKALGNATPALPPAFPKLLIWQRKQEVGTRARDNKFSPYQR